MGILQKQEQDQYEKMTTAPVPGLILSLALPSIVTMLITSVYNLADTFFVGRIGTSATAAVGVVFSIPMILNALGFLVGTGASSLMSRMLGAKQLKEAKRVTSTGFFLSFFFGLLVAVVGFLAGESLMTLLGATDTILPYAMAYGRYIFFGAPFAASSLALSQCLRGEGLSKESMTGQVFGGVLNMVLDPLFIFVFHLGIAGAAMATAISQMISWGILISFYLRGKTQVPISIHSMSRTKKQYLELFSNGFPSLSRHGCNMIANVVLNWVAGGWGDAAIAAMSVCSRLLYLSNAVSLGLGQGAQPVFGYSHGAGNHKRVKEAFWFTAKAGAVSMCFFSMIGVLFAPGCQFCLKYQHDVSDDWAPFAQHGADLMSSVVFLCAGPASSAAVFRLAGTAAFRTFSGFIDGMYGSSYDKTIFSVTGTVKKRTIKEKELP